MEEKNGYKAFMLLESLIPPPTKKANIIIDSFFPDIRLVENWVKDGLMTREEAEELLQKFLNKDEVC